MEYFIITTHDYVRHRSLEETQKEMLRLQEKHPRKLFELRHCLDDKDSSRLHIDEYD